MLHVGFFVATGAFLYYWRFIIFYPGQKVTEPYSSLVYKVEVGVGVLQCCQKPRTLLSDQIRGWKKMEDDMNTKKSEFTEEHIKNAILKIKVINLGKTFQLRHLGGMICSLSTRLIFLLIMYSKSCSQYFLNENSYPFHFPSGRCCTWVNNA